MEKTLLKPASKFFIGFFASLCAVFVPRMLATLNELNGSVQLFNPQYITVGLAFSAIIGVVTAILEQSKNRSSAETFMTALGIPALLAGALNTGTASVDLHNSEMEKQKLVAALKQQSAIPIDEEAVDVQLLQPTSTGPHSRFDFSLVPSAYAMDNPGLAQQSANHLGMQADQRNFLVVVLKFNTQAEAQKAVDSLKARLPHATVVQVGKQFMVVESTEKRTRSSALLKAVELKNNSQLQPSLLKVN